VKVSLFVLALIAGLLGLGYWYYRKELMPKSGARPIVPAFDATATPQRAEQVMAGSIETDPLASFEHPDYFPAFGSDANGVSEREAWMGPIEGIRAM